MCPWLGKRAKRKWGHDKEEKKKEKLEENETACTDFVLITCKFDNETLLQALI